jgi:hypothetical protein
VLMFEDGLAFSELTESEVAATAPSPSICRSCPRSSSPPIWTARCWCDTMIVDDSRAAQERGDLVHAATPKQTLRDFIEQHRAQAGAGGLLGAGARPRPLIDVMRAPAPGLLLVRNVDAASWGLEMERILVALGGSEPREKR